MRLMPDRNPVGLIGIGLLGQAFAHRLLDAGFEVVGFDVDPVKNAKLAELGGRPASSVADLARRCDPIVLAVFSTDQVEVVTQSELVPAVEPVLRALFATYFNMGKIGDGGRAKLAVNLILGLNRLAVAEGLVFAERLGLDPAAFLKVARSSAAYSQVMDIKGSKMIRGEFTAEGRVTQHLKDVHLMLEQAERVKQRLPLLELHADVLEACVRQGEGDLDNSAVIKEIRRRMLP